MRSYIDDERGGVLIIEMIVLAIVLAAGSFAVYRYLGYQNSSYKMPKPQPHLAANPTPSQSPTKPAYEFDVQELGFKMTLPPGLTGLKYVVQLNQTGTANNQSYQFSTVRFSSDDMMAADSSQYCTPAQGPLGFVAEYAEDPRTLGLDPRLVTAKKVGSHYLSFVGPESPCGSNSSTALQVSLSKLLRQAVDTAEPLP